MTQTPQSSTPQAWALFTGVKAAFVYHYYFFLSKATGPEEYPGYYPAEPYDYLTLLLFILYLQKQYCFKT